MPTQCVFVPSAHGRRFVRKRQKLEEFARCTLLEQKNRDSAKKQKICRSISPRKNQVAEVFVYMRRSELCREVSKTRENCDLYFIASGCSRHADGLSQARTQDRN